MTFDHSQPFLDALVPGVSFRQYRLLERVGVGGQGVVWSAVDETRKRIYAIKFSEIIEGDFARLEDAGNDQHLNRLVQLNHPYILPFLDYGYEQNVRFTISPYMPGFTLAHRTRISPLPFNEVLRYGAEVGSALDYLHQQGIIHRDLKTSNILLDMSGRSYLADFGLARLISSATLAFHTGHGTPPYASPEQIMSKELTPRSDIYSFGIMLYELFAGQLPWNGKKQLGMEQTHSNQEIPDPREFNERIPSLTVEVLKRATSADPNSRPSSAGEVVNMLRQVFKISPSGHTGKASIKESDTVNRDVQELLNLGLKQWKSTSGTYAMGLTKFALVDLARGEFDHREFGRFMLAQALTYGYHDDHWWTMIRNPRERLAVASELLMKRSEAITGRIVTHLIADQESGALSSALPENIIAFLLETGTTTTNLFVRQQLFEGMRVLTRSRRTWNDSSLNQEHLKLLGNIALEDSESGDAAAKLIGHLHSPTAVRTVAGCNDDERKFGALQLIQREAGSLPSLVESNLRLRLLLESNFNQLIQQPLSLISGYIMAFLGASLGIGLQVYFTYRLPDFFDSARITTSVEQGLIIGSIFGLGIFIPRIVVERFQTPATTLRVILASIVGGLIINLSVVISHVLFLDTSPTGWLITTGSIMIALIFALCSLIRFRLIRMGLSILSVFVAILGTWVIHSNFSVSVFDLAPIFRYDYAMSLNEIAYIAFAASFFIGVFGQLIKFPTMQR